MFKTPRTHLVIASRRRGNLYHRLLRPVPYGAGLRRYTPRNDYTENFSLALEEYCSNVVRTISYN